MADQLGASDLKSLQQDFQGLRKWVEQAVQDINKQLHEQEVQMTGYLMAETPVQKPHAQKVGRKVQDRMCNEKAEERVEHGMIQTDLYAATEGQMLKPSQVQQELLQRVMQVQQELLQRVSKLEAHEREAGDALVEEVQEDRIAKLEALVDNSRVSELKGEPPDDAAAMDRSEDEGGAPDLKKPMPQFRRRQSMQSEDTKVDYFYSLAESTWDVVVLIGEPAVGKMASVFVTGLVLLNIAIQLMLCFIINDVFTDPAVSEDDVMKMRYWRTFFAHSPSLMNEYTHEPYARAVCRDAGGIQMVTDAVDLARAIEEYLPTQENYDEEDPLVGHIFSYDKNIGVILSLYAVMIWTLEIIHSLILTWFKFSAFYAVPSGQNSMIVDVGSSCRRVIKFWTGRKLLCLSSAAIEFLILVLLGINGAFFIMRTLGMQDLLLNCAALVIVLELDELVFAALVPQKCRYLLKSLEDLPRPAPAQFMGLSTTTYFSMIILIGTMTGSKFILMEQKSVLDDVHYEICGGNLDFIASPDGAGVMTAGFDAQEDDPDVAFNSYNFKAVRQLVINEAGNVVTHRLDKLDMSGGSSGIDGGPWSLTRWTNAGLDVAMGYWNVHCVDMLPTSNGEYEYSNHFLHILQDAAKSYDIQDCSHVKKWCNDASSRGIRARQVCPDTCGCKDVGAKLLLVGETGCSPTCTTSPDYNQSLWNRTCTDLDVESPYWKDYNRSMKEYLMSWGDVGGFNISEATFIAANGCNIVSKAMPIKVLGVDWPDPCKMFSLNIKPFTYACPVSCHCRSDDPLPFCPESCR